MAQAAWEKPIAAPTLRSSNGGRWKFLVGGLLIVGAIAYLIISGTLTGASFFITVDEVVNDPEFVNETVRVSGAVLGDSIRYDAENMVIEFTVVNIPQEFDNLAQALHEAVENPNATMMQVRVENQPMPDLLQHEAQAILTGELGPDGVFNANELLLKCPSRFEEAGVDQSIGQPHPSMSGANASGDA